MVEQSNYGYEEAEEEEQPDNTEMWKKFGRESEIGKQLYSIYGAREKPKINYPPLKTKKKVPE